MEAAPRYLLEVRHIVKLFGDLKANDDVSLAIAPGEIHALLGENGAGKSTLVKIIYGALQPASGELYWKGKPVTIANPAAARTLGIGMVFQHFSLFEALSVAENIALALPPGDFDLQALARKITEVSKAYGLPLEPSATVADLSVGERQRIEIVRCLLQEPKLLIMDEPTAVLTPQEADQLFVVLERLAGEGCAVLYISHRLEEVKRLCHTATILRQGKVVANVDPRKETAASLARLMVGADIHIVRPARANKDGKPRLRLANLRLPAESPFAVALKDISLDVHGGEIVAIAGVAGNGQSELFDAISGERSLAGADELVIDGTPCGHRGITFRRRLGAAFVPEERLGHAGIPGFRLSENVVLTRHSADASLVKSGLIQRSEASDISDRVSKTFDVRKGKPDPEARALSGGNLQKFVVGRELDREPSVLVVNQPTWGVDAGAAATIRQALIDLAQGGSAVLVISQDLDEIFEIADRIAVISRGELSEAFPAAKMDAERIGLLMAGAHELKRIAMRLVLEKRPERSQVMAILSPLLAIALTVIAGGIIFALLGIPPLHGLYVYFIEPLTQGWSIEQLIVKATPLVLIGVGLAVCYRANVWNIGAEGQFTAGAILGGMIPVLFPVWQSPLTLLAMLVFGIAGGMIYGLIPALLKNRFNANEILTSLMLVYVAQLFLDWLVRGPWRDPQGFNFPKSITFEGWQLLPTFGGTIHLGVVFAILAVLALALVMGRTLKGFEIRVIGNAPRAGRFAGFSRENMVVFAFLLSGGLAGLAGISEVASVVAQLQPTISPGYGFAAIIVAFLGRLNPIGVLLAGLMLALSYIGGEAAQISLGVSDKIARVFQGMLLFFILACDTLILYRVSLMPGSPRTAG